MFFCAVDDPTKLLLKRRDREQLCSKHRFIVKKDMVSAVFHKTMDEVFWKVVKNVLLRAQKHQGIVQKKEGFTVIGVNLVSVNRRG